MKYTLISLAILLVIAGVYFIASRLFRTQSGEAGGFRDWLKNPDYKQVAADHFAARDALEVPVDISDAEIQKMVDRLFAQEDKDFNFDRLKLVGSKAVPYLITALEDPKTKTKQFGEGDHILDAKSPFERICKLLGAIGPAEAALPLAKYIDHEDDQFRKQAALVLGNIGTDECIAAMLKALDDDEDYVRSYAMMGIQSGIDSERCTKEFLDAMFPALKKLLNRDDSSISGTAPELLFTINSNRALPILLSPEYFTVENDEVRYIIRALNAADHKIPHESLLPFLKAVKPQINDYPHDYEYAEALLALARNPDASAEETFRAEMKSSNDRVQEAAAEALAVFSGVTNVRDVVFETLDNCGYDALSQPQKHYFTVFCYHGEVNNGGHSQYFVNSSGDHWKDAIKGLKAIGANSRLNILDEATRLFGSKGPSEDNSKRHQQISGFSSRQDQLLGELDGKYYECDENIEVLLSRYAIAHKEHFIAPQ